MNRLVNCNLPMAFAMIILTCIVVANWYAFHCSTSQSVYNFLVCVSVFVYDVVRLLHWIQ